MLNSKCKISKKLEMLSFASLIFFFLYLQIGDMALRGSELISLTI